MTRSFKFIFLLVLMASIQAHAQVPKGINYQGVARLATGTPIADKTISIRISVLQNSANGTSEYAETHQPATNEFGLFTLVIGQGTLVTGDFDFISWANGSKWLQIEMDPEGGSNYSLIGSQQLMSVPYSYYAQYSGSTLKAGQGLAIENNIITNTGDGDNNAANELNTNMILGSDKVLRITDAGGTKQADLSVLVGTVQNLSQVLTQGNDAGAQKITNLATPINGTDAATKLYVDAHDDADANSTNEIQDLSLTGNSLKVTNNATASTINLAPYLDNTDNQNLTLTTPVTGTSRTVNVSNGTSATFDVADNDNSNTNEIQLLTKTGSTIALSAGGGSVSLNDDSNTNEIQTLASVLGVGNDASTLRIINLGTPITPGDATTKQYVDNLDVADLDKSATNEIQNLTSVLGVSNNAGTLKITNLGGPTIATDASTKQYVDNLDAADLDKSATNEIQNLASVLGTNNDAGTLKITNLGTPTLASDATTKQYVDNLDAADLDKSITNEIQNLAGVLGVNNSAGNLKITNLATPTLSADATTKLYVDNLDATDLDKSATNEIQGLAGVLGVSNDASALKIINLGAPTLASDATTKQYVDNLDAADLDKSTANEIQTISKARAARGEGIDFPDDGR